MLKSEISSVGYFILGIDFVSDFAYFLISI
jgi:hypothetical protein